MIIIGDLIGQVDNLCFKRRARLGLIILNSITARTIIIGGVLDNPFTGFPTEVQTVNPGITMLQLFNNPQLLAVVLETTMILHQTIQNVLSGVTEGCMP